MTVTEKINHFASIKSNGAILRTQNIVELVSIIDIPGNILEIGAGEGETTVKIIDKISETDRKIVVVDPWDGGMGPYNKSGFEYNVNAYCIENPPLIIIEMDSQTESARKEIYKNGPYCFAFVDGLQHEFEQVYYDVETCALLNIPIICVDDYNYRPNTVKPAIEKAIQEYDYYCVGGRGHETYLIWRGYDLHNSPA